MLKYVHIEKSVVFWTQFDWLVGLVALGFSLHVYVWIGLVHKLFIFGPMLFFLRVFSSFCCCCSSFIAVLVLVLLLMVMMCGQTRYVCAFFVCLLVCVLYL